MGRWYYHYSDLRVASELELPEWRVFESRHPFADPEVVICLEPANPAAPLLPPTPEKYSFRIEGVGEYCVSEGREIRITVQAGTGYREARLFLLGSAWGILCYQRELLVLHTSVVQVRDQAVAFCGASGSGKSSVAAWLAGQGYPPVGDDLCRIELGAEEPRVYPSAPRLKLWRDTLAKLGWRDDDLERDHFRMDKYHVPTEPGAAQSDPPALTASLRLRAIYLLAWGELGITRLTGLAALRGLVESATYRGELLESLGQVAAHWQRCAMLARGVPVYQFTRPFDWATMETAMQRLLAHWSSNF